MPDDAGVFLEVENHAVPLALGDKAYFIHHLLKKTIGLHKTPPPVFKFGGPGLIVVP
jgi:hypothetical protein